MEVKEIDINTLFVSELNVRKTLTSDEDETGISDLANDIRANGLINPITVRKMESKYEIIAGQRRYLACKLLNKPTIPCNIVDVTRQKAEEISLVENVQRNPMTNSDKIKTYSKLYQVYNKDIDKVISVINISKITLSKYLKLNSLPEDIIKLLDSNSETKLTIEVAVELTKLPEGVDKIEVVKNIQTLTSVQKIKAIKDFIKNECDDAEDIIEIKEDIALQDNSIVLAPSFPYVKDKDGKNVKIPTSLFEDVVELIKCKIGTLEYVE
jgi:ParB family chromosome partitioning protein